MRLARVRSQICSHSSLNSREKSGVSVSSHSQVAVFRGIGVRAGEANAGVHVVEVGGTSGGLLQFLQYPASSLIARRNHAGHGILRNAGDQTRRMTLNQSSGTYLHPTRRQTIACSAFYEVTISAKPQPFEFSPHLNGNTARYPEKSTTAGTSLTKPEILS